MKVEILPGKYVVAVSGGVDSVVLLDMLASKAGPWKLIIAHFDHGMRADSAEDRKFVEELAKSRRLPFEYTEGKLGSGASEATARAARYEFLENVRAKHAAKAIVTAHHQDDVIETALINMLRGTGRKGLSSLRSTDVIIRPLLTVPKKELIAYADKNKLAWREDPTNQDTKYLRNQVRHEIVPKLTAAQRKKFLSLLTDLRAKNTEINDQIANFLQFVSEEHGMNRSNFIQLPHAVAREVMAEWLRSHGARGFDKKTLERLVVSAKTLAPGKKSEVNGEYYLMVQSKNLKLIPKHR